MTKFLAVALIAVCALTASLYATAAPTKQGPTNAQLAAQVRALKADVKSLTAYVDKVNYKVHTVDSCELQALWLYQARVWQYLKFGSGNTAKVPEAPTFPSC